MAEDLKEMIVHGLVDRRNRSDIIQAVCEQASMDWPRAEELVTQVELEQAHAIAARQTPVLVFLSACISAAGILLVVYATRITVDAVGDGPLWQNLLIMADSTPIWLFIVGVCMIAGGIVGMYRTMLRFFET